MMITPRDAPNRVAASNRGKMLAATSAALLAVSGTATIAWAAMGLAFGPGSEPRMPVTPEIAGMSGTTAAFVTQSRDMASAAPEMRAPVRLASVSLPSADPLPVFEASVPVMATVLAPAVTPESAALAGVRPVARPEQPAPVRVAAAPLPERVPAQATRVQSKADPEEKRGERLTKIWSVGAFR